ncbi:RidA family protein [Paenibacillus sp. SYP-B3998]|uniref:RidA family protein n=2 Tax=Paenibacillus sp. SYP-B3998 TaxID=2678564 RepID=A0A6G3ZXL4_9BACL|nr:RidA family protein [Paenibacillus sp. SYP-B3998]
MIQWDKSEIITRNAPRDTGPYSQGLIAGPFVFVSGQGPLDPDTGEIVDGTVEEQTILTFKNIEAILAEAGATLQDVVKVTAHLQDINDFDKFSQTYETLFTDSIKPVRTTVGSQLVGIKVEADVIAILARSPV